MRNSVVWACLDLRASLISSLPVEQYTRQGDGREKAQKLAPLWRDPGPGALFVGGPIARLDEWLYATQVDLDRFGNAFGLITQRDALQRPIRIDLTPARSWTVTVKPDGVHYVLDGKEIDPQNVWHERAHVTAGSPVGLDPLAMAAMALGTHDSASDFAGAWFSSGGMASATLKNTLASLTPEQAVELKERVRSTMAAGDVLVLGKEYEYKMQAVPPNQTAFLEMINATQVDLTRFFGVPADMVDVHESGSSITYANVTQRNMQFLTLHLGPAIRRRENAMSGAIASPQRIELETDGFLRMDPMQQAQVDQIYVNARIKHPDEIRTRLNFDPLTGDQIESFGLLFAKVTEKVDGMTPTSLDVSVSDTTTPVTPVGATDDGEAADGD